MAWSAVTAAKVVAPIDRPSAGLAPCAMWSNPRVSGRSPKLPLHGFSKSYLKRNSEFPMRELYNDGRFSGWSPPPE
ncbi:hypothetical protein MKUB_55420 [Mycobacterium kubicae]|uniref:Uncharacterized protein n=1 Tax=Mycobacterium kubicae TaxID=120959 RepID=A0ABQ1BWD0_9MYCO|nr:hypothetical protein MKUB_55420 [Mycobacterium kubicae]